MILQVPDSDLAKRRIGQMVDPMSGAVFIKRVYNPGQQQQQQAGKGKEREEDQEEEEEEDEDNEDDDDDDTDSQVDEFVDDLVSRICTVILILILFINFHCACYCFGLFAKFYVKHTIFDKKCAILMFTCIIFDIVLKIYAALQ